MKIVVNDIQGWRNRAVVHRAAMLKALHSVVVGETTLLEQAMAIAASPEVPVTAKISWDAVTQFERWNPDIQQWAPLLFAGHSDAFIEDAIDMVFRIGEAIDAGNADQATSLSSNLQAFLDAPEG